MLGSPPPGPAPRGLQQRVMTMTTMNLTEDQRTRLHVETAAMGGGDLKHGFENLVDQVVKEHEATANIRTARRRSSTWLPIICQTATGQSAE